MSPAPRRHNNAGKEEAEQLQLEHGHTWSTVEFTRLVDVRIRRCDFASKNRKKKIYIYNDLISNGNLYAHIISLLRLCAQSPAFRNSYTWHMITTTTKTKANAAEMPIRMMIA